LHGTFDGNYARLYVNGKEVARTDAPPSPAGSTISYDGFTDGQDLLIGNYGSPESPLGSFGFTGDICEVTIWPGALRAREIAVLVDPTFGEFGDDPVLDNLARNDNRRFELTIKLRKEHFPFWNQGKPGSVRRVDILVRSTNPSLVVSDKADRSDESGKIMLGKNSNHGNILTGELTFIPPTALEAELKLFFDEKVMEDLWLAVTWSSEEV
jgi:hypothetical protein